MTTATTTAAAGFPLEAGYARLPEDFFARVAPTRVAAPSLVRLNTALAEQLGLSPEALASPDGVALLAGNAVFEGLEPIAMAYAGHQFGNWVPMLGDGRAILLGEIVDRDGVRRDIQLKGAGPTPFSRGGDGRAALGPVLREYVLCEAMFALGIPTTRALAMVRTGESVERDDDEPGAVLTRVASGHVRVGTFQYFHGRGMPDAVRTLADYVIERQYADAKRAANPYRALLEAVVERQADLISRWLLVGFIHGVMNTDNMSIMGETIDYGPCAFMDEYDGAKVYSSIDRRGRYAYNQQPAIGQWNLTRFAETLLPLLADSEDAAVASAQEALATYAGHFQRSYDQGLCRKLGLQAVSEVHVELASTLLEAMAANKADFTLTFRRLGELDASDSSQDARVGDLFDDPAEFDAWALRWRASVQREGRDALARQREMQATNPAFIPRNHRVQQAIDGAMRGDLQPLDALLTVTAQPFDEHPRLAEYAAPPQPHEVIHATFCGT